MKQRLLFISFWFIGTTIFAHPLFAADTVIGVAGPMTGGLAAFGEQIQHGAQIASENINKEGGLLGNTLSVYAEDDACDPKQARIVAGKMVAEKTSVVFGHWCSASTMAASSVYGEENVLQIDVGGLLKKYTQQGFKNAFRVSATSAGFAKAIGTYTTQHNPNANVVIITDQPAVTLELTEELKKFFSTTNNKVVDVEEIRGGDKDFSSIIDKFKSLDPKVVICSCYTVEAGLVARQLSEKKLDVFYYGWDTLNSPDFLSIIGNADAGKIVSIDYARPPASDTLKKFSDKLRAKNWPVETTTILTYAAFQVFADAVRIAKSFNTTEIAKALHTNTFSTVIGDVRFDANGDRVDPHFATYQWIQGKLKMTGELAP